VSIELKNKLKSRYPLQQWVVVRMLSAPGPAADRICSLRWTGRNGPRAARSGQRAEPAVTELDRLAMNSPPGSAVPNSHDGRDRGDRDGVVQVGDGEVSRRVRRRLSVRYPEEDVP
jgi:hypothetical protein